jgi:hypothetical protein
MNFKHKVWASVPCVIRNTVDIKRREIYWLNANCIFVHIPKSAGVSINNALYGRPLGHFTASQIKKSIRTTYDKSYTFSVMRDPIERVLSAYKFAKNGSSSKTHKFIDSKLFREFNSIDEFVIDYLQYKDVTKLDGIFKPQYEYILDNGKLAVNKVYSIKQLAELENDLNDKYGFNINIRRENVSIYNNMERPMSKISEILVREIYKKDYLLIDELNLRG